MMSSTTSGGKPDEPEPEFTIAGDEEDNGTDASVAVAMPVTNPNHAPTLQEIQQQTQPTTVSMNGHVPSQTVPYVQPYSVNTQGVNRSAFGPAGSWSAVFCGCCQTFFTPLFWMGWCCTPCVYGQLLQRLRLNLLGLPANNSQSGVCMWMTMLTAVVYLMYFSFTGWLIDIFWYLFLLYVLFVGFTLRGHLRSRFGIGPLQLPCCDGVLEDGLISIFCCCCNAIQMTRQTHNEVQYPYNPCSNNGLASYAPEIWTPEQLKAGLNVPPSYGNAANENHTTTNGDDQNAGDVELSNNSQTGISTRRNSTAAFPDDDQAGRNMANVEIV